MSDLNAMPKMDASNSKGQTVAIVCGAVGVLAIAIILAVVLVSAQPTPTPTPFEAHEGEGEPGQLHLALIKSPTCPHCVAVTPIFEQLQADDSTVQIVDGTLLHYDWFVENGVTGFPTVCAMRGNQVVYIHRGPRTREAIVKFWNNCTTHQYTTPTTRIYTGTGCI